MLIGLLMLCDAQQPSESENKRNDSVLPHVQFSSAWNSIAIELKNEIKRPYIIGALNTIFCMTE